MASKIRECIICGSKYKACVDCSKYGGWKSICDTADHYKIYCLMQDFKNGRSKKEIKAEMDTISKNSLKNVLPEVKDFLDKEIYTSPKPKKTKVETKDSPSEN